MIITLTCGSCENQDCKYCPVGKYVPEDSKEGCTRDIDEDLYINHQNLLYEQWPFRKMMREEEEKELYNCILNNFKYIYDTPMVSKLGKSGKVVKIK